MNTPLARQLFASVARSAQRNMAPVNDEALLEIANDIEYIDSMVNQMGADVLGEEDFFSYQEKIRILRRLVEKKEKERREKTL